MIANTTWRVTNAYGSSAMRVRDAEYTTKQPVTVSTPCVSSSTQSTLRLGIAGARADVAEPAVGLCAGGTSTPCVAPQSVVRSESFDGPIPPNLAFAARRVGELLRRRGAPCC